MKVEIVNYKTKILTLENSEEIMLIARALLTEGNESLKILEFHLRRNNEEKADNTILKIKKIIQVFKDLEYETISNELNEKLEKVVAEGGVVNE